ncbi:MAG: hypothetical protein SPM09_13305 [Fibrobacter sp.]|uniref:hypothetical protein n=1 Tax=Fibrobacter sp. TaxID=35828 RepID=UPI002A920647|nr:hypothetical protein [Fibrobacter sp.]MDY6265375.1 hypothetical protein [Fibrobacter sp.]
MDFKKIFLGSVIAMGAFGLIACGDDSSTNASNKDNGKIVIPDNNAPNISANGLVSRVSGDTLRFKGIYGLDRTDETNENSSNLLFTAIKFQVMNSAQQEVQYQVIYNEAVVPTANEIDLNSMMSAFVKINLKDPIFTCDDYSLVVTVTANDGAKDYYRTDVIPFDAEAKTELLCKNVEPASSASADPGLNEIIMTPCEELTLTSNGEQGIDLASCTVVPAATANIVFVKSGTKSEPDVTANAGAGITFVNITNEDYGDGSWPEVVNNRPAYLSDFKTSTIEKTSLPTLIENGEGLSYVAKTAAYNPTTGAGFYPFAVYGSDFPDKNGYYTFKVKIYRVQ